MPAWLAGEMTATVADTDERVTADAPGFLTLSREWKKSSIDVTIPRNRLTVITGLSGSGKSSLAFETIYSEA